MRAMRRIVILGNAGSGKSTLARALGQRLGLPVVYLDRLFWEPGWVQTPTDVFRARVSEAMSGDGWICEGNYHRQTFDLRLPCADLVIWLDTGQVKCLMRVIMRSALNRPRDDLPAGCVEKLDADFLAFLKYVWTFDREKRPAIESHRLALAAHVPVVRLRGARQMSRFLESLRG